MNFIIREARPEDAASIHNLVLELAEFERAPNAVVTSENDIIRHAFCENPLIYVYVAESEHKIVGMALYFYSYSTWKGRSLHLEDLIVNENYRGLGIGKALMNKIIEIAKEECVERLSWEVLDWNQNAIRFYESLGANFYKNWWLCRLFKEDLEKL